MAGPPRSREESLGQLLPLRPRKEPNLPTPWSQTSALENCETVNFCRVKAPSVWGAICYGSPRTLVQALLHGPSSPSAVTSSPSPPRPQAPPGLTCCSIHGHKIDLAHLPIQTFLPSSSLCIVFSCHTDHMTFFKAYQTFSCLYARGSHCLEPPSSCLMTSYSSFKPAQHLLLCKVCSTHSSAEQAQVFSGIPRAPHTNFL